MSFAKRYWLALACGVLTLLGLIVGVLGLTVLAPAQQVQASAQFDRPYAITREGVLSLYADEVTVTVTAPEGQTAWIALGAANDVASWVESQGYAEIIGVENTLEDLATTAYGEAAQSGAMDGDSSASFTDSETETTDPAETTDTNLEGKEAQSGATSENPLVSDMWWSPVRFGTNTVTMHLSGDQLDGAIVVATDGVGVAPSVTLAWPTATPYYLAIFSFIFSTVFLVCTLLVSLMYVHRVRRHSNSAKKRKIIEESASTDTTSIAVPEMALLEGPSGGTPVAGELTAGFAADSGAEPVDTAAGMGGVIDENMPEAAFTAAFDPGVVEVEVPGGARLELEPSRDSDHGQNGEAGFEPGSGGGLVDSQYNDVPFTGIPAANADYPADFDADNDQHVDPTAVDPLLTEYPALAEGQYSYAQMAPDSSFSLSPETQAVDYFGADYLETSPTQMGGYQPEMEVPLNFDASAPFGADGTGAAGMVEIEMASTLMENMEPYPVDMEAVPLNYDYTDCIVPNRMGETQVSSGMEIERVPTDSGMLNMTALQVGRQFPSRRALREAEQRGVVGLIVDGKLYTTGINARIDGTAGDSSQDSPQVQDETGEKSHG